MFSEINNFIRSLYPEKEIIALHEPQLGEEEKRLLCDCIDSTFVSSLGSYVDEFERQIAEYTGAKYAVAVVNGTMGLFTCLKLLDVDSSCEVITQSLTFVATVNAIKYTGADPVLVDVDEDTMGMSPTSLRSFLEANTFVKERQCFNKTSGKKIAVCMPMHTLGVPCEIDEIKSICEEFFIELIEDAAESLGSYFDKVHTGRFGKMGVFSFNGNKIITTGGGGIIITDDEELGKKAKHITTTAKIPHPWEFDHDMLGYNFRMPNINAALGVAQLAKLKEYLQRKLEISNSYNTFFRTVSGCDFFYPKNEKVKWNHWLNAISFSSEMEKNSFLEKSNQNKIFTRPLWKPVQYLSYLKNNNFNSLKQTEDFYNRYVCLPSGVN